MIATFYSYKGGVGRTQLVANIAAYLCYYKSQKVLLIDWDLEAPGLDFYFNMPRSEMNKGVIDLFSEYVRLVKQRETVTTEKLPKFDAQYINQLIATPKGCIDLIPAGKYDENYTQNTVEFDWSEFYENLDGKLYIEFLKDELYKLDYDFIFIDSRTGISDYSGICNIQMPDMNVLVTVPNKQNFEGCLRIAKSIVDSPYIESGNYRKGIILPILSRLDRESEKADEWIAKFKKEFAVYIKNLFNTHFSEREEEMMMDNFLKETFLEYTKKFSVSENILFDEKAEIISGISLKENYKNIAEWIERISNQVGRKNNTKTQRENDVDYQQKALTERKNTLEKQLFVLKNELATASSGLNKVEIFSQINQTETKIATIDLDIDKLSQNQVQSSRVIDNGTTINQKPIIFLASANLRGHRLRHLPVELDNIRQILEKTVTNGYCDLTYKENINYKDFQEFLLHNSNKICVFHFSGHGTWQGESGKYSAISFIGEDGNEELVKSDSLVESLKELKNLKLIFLNTEEGGIIAEKLIEVGIPAVIGLVDANTNDAVAADFATQFYYSLAEQNTIEFAFNYAVRYLTMTGEYQEDKITKTKFTSKKVKSNIPYQLFYKDEAAKNWKLAGE